MIEPRKDIFGYFEDKSEKPVHDPGLKTICAVCAKNLRKPLQTISLMPFNKRNRSYFFRVHKKCWEEASKREKMLIESSLVDNLED